MRTVRRMKWVANLRIGQKFALIGAAALAMALPPTALLVTKKSELLRAAAYEQAGLVPASDVLALVQAAQKHRGLSNAVLGGNQSMAADRRAAQAQVQQALDRALASSAPYRDQPDMRQRTDHLGQDWSAIAEAVAAGRWTSAESFAHHTALVERGLDWMNEVVDASTMALDPEAAGYYLVITGFTHLPALAEQLGQTRARGALALTRKTLAPEDRAALALAAQQAGRHLASVQHMLGKAGQADPSSADALQPLVDRAQAAQAHMMALLDQEILSAPALAYPPAEWFAAATAAIDAHYALTGAAVRQLSARLDQRVADHRRELGLTLAMVLLASLVAGGLMWAVARGVLRTVGEAGRAAHALAEGDLTHHVASAGADEIGRMAHAVDTSIGRLAGLVDGVRERAEAVALATRQIAGGNQDLSARTEAQAASLEQTAGAMVQMTASVDQTRRHALEARTLAEQANGAARESSERVDAMVRTMSDIEQSGRRVAEIVGVMDTIAFQTNLLALNAAVEAARAGSHGRGFSVVASDVRALAQRSASAAADIRGHIAESTECVQRGDRHSQEARAAIHGVQQRLEAMAALAGEIAVAAEEQSRGIHEVNGAVAQIDRGTQQNAALVEQTAAAARSLQDQAGAMVAALGVFRTAAA